MPSAKSKLILEATSPKDGTNLKWKPSKEAVEKMDTGEKHSKETLKKEEGLRNIETR